MKVTLHPQASHRTTIVSVSGSTVIVDGESYDLSFLNGGDAKADLPFSPYHRQSEEHVHIVYQYDQLKASNEQPEVTYEVANGEVPCPIVWKESDNV